MSRRRAPSFRPPARLAMPSDANAGDTGTPTRKTNLVFRLLIWLIVGGAILVTLAVGVWIAWWVYFHIVIDIAIRDQKMGVTLPEKIHAVAEITNELDVAMRGEIETRVPFNQALTVPLDGRYDLDVELRAKVPLEFEVTYEGILPIDTEADVRIRTGINYKNLKSLRNLDIQTKIPLEFPLPVKLRVPVDQVIDLEYVGPLTADINDELKTVVNTTLKTRLPIDQTIRTPVTAALPLNLYPPKTQVRAILTSLDVALRPSSMLKWSVASAEERKGPIRIESPWGPADSQASSGTETGSSSH